MGDKLVYFSLRDPTGQVRWIESIVYRTPEEADKAATRFLKTVDPAKYLCATRPEVSSLRPHHGGKLYLESRLLPGSSIVYSGTDTVSLTATFEWRAVETWSEPKTVVTGGHTYERLELHEDEAACWSVNRSPVRPFTLYIQRFEWSWG